MRRSFLVSHAVMFFGIFMFVSQQVFADDFANREQEAKKVTKQFLKQLGKAMGAAMKDGGATNAISVCSKKAPEIAAEMSRKTGWRVTRVGTRVRNSLIGIPDSWEQKVLQQFAERKAKGESFKKMTYAEIVEEPGGKYFRFMKAIGVKPVCLQCHGDKEQVLPEVEMILEDTYPHDHARNYKVGDLRGAVSIKQPL